jgi:uncharacterized spore protein YtfJ
LLVLDPATSHDDWVKLSELLSFAREAFVVEKVFGEAVTSDNVTVIPVARLIAGGGGGGGHDDSLGQDGAGGGFGLFARPAGAFVIKDGDVRWKPVYDWERVALAAGLGVLIWARRR